MNGIITQFRQWFSQPFNVNMSASGWFFFFGLLIVISALWAIVLSHIKSAGEVVGV